MLRRLATTFTALLFATASALAQSPAGQDGFVPASSLPPGQEIPAAPLLIGSYATFLLLMMFYLWTIWRRIGRVEKELHELQRRQGAAGR
ncbi:MAG: hypothetical protein ABL961_00145 [Vicinamibacterales bacterium]